MMAAGPPVVLFPSLAGSVLECEESSVKTYEGTRIWMGLKTLMASETSFAGSVESSSPSSTDCESGDLMFHREHPFVKHLMLDSTRPGKDVPGVKVAQY